MEKGIVLSDLQVPIALEVTELSYYQLFILRHSLPK